MSVVCPGIQPPPAQIPQFRLEPACIIINDGTNLEINRLVDPGPEDWQETLGSPLRVSQPSTPVNRGGPCVLGERVDGAERPRLSLVAGANVSVTGA